MSLSDEDTGMVNGLSKSKLENLGLKATLQEILKAETKDEIKLHFTLIEHTNTNKTSQKSVSYKLKHKLQLEVHLAYEAPFPRKRLFF